MTLYVGGRKCAEVSGPSEVPQFVGELIFQLFKETKLVCLCSIIECSRVQVIASSTKHQFLRNNIENV